MLAFGPFTLDFACYELRRDGEKLFAERRVFDVLRYLIEHRDRVVSREELIEQVWGGVSVSPNALTRVIAVLRKLLDDDTARPRWIATVYGRGYHFLGELRDAQSERSLPAQAIEAARDYRQLLVGRHAEREALAAAMTRAHSGASGVVLLEGEAGIGKSRLLEWCAEEALRRSLTPLLSRCREDEGAPPLWPWIEIVRSVQALVGPDRAGLLSRAQPALSHLFPELGGLERRSHASAESDPRGLRFRAYTGLADLLRAASARAPIVLLFDDLHRADLSSISLLEFLVAQLAGTRVLMVGSLRPASGDRDGLARIARDPRCRTLSLPGFTEAEVLSLLTAAVPEHGSPALAQRIWKQTGGNAFFVHQLIPLAARLDIQNGTISSMARTLPSTIRKAIEQQCATLSPISLRMLRAGAVLGHEISAQLLAEVMAQTLETTLDALDEALRMHVLAPCLDTPQSYRFAHALVRDVLYEELRSNERSELHMRVAAALEARCADAPQLAGELAHHFSSAGPLCRAKAVHYRHKAGDFAAARFAYQMAADHYRVALQILDAQPQPDVPRRCDLTIALARQTYYAGFGEAATELWGQAAERARAMSDPARLARIAIDFSAGLDSPIQGIRLDLAMPLLDEAVRVSGECSPSQRARLLARQAQSLALSRSHVAAERAAAAALALARETGEPAALAEVLTFEVRRRIDTPDASTRAEIAAEVVAHSERAGNRSMQFIYLGYQIAALAECGRFDAADVVIARYGWLAEEIRSPVDIAVWYQLRVMRSLMRGEWSAALPLIQHARVLVQHCEPSLLHELGRMSAAIAMETGGPSDAILDLASHRTEGAWPALRLLVYQQLRRPDLIAQEIDAEMSRLTEARECSKPWLASAAGLAEVISYMQDANRARLVLEWLQGFEQLRALGGVYWGPVLLTTGTLCRTLGDWRRALEHLEAALRMVQEDGALPSECRVRIKLAATHAKRHQPGDLAPARRHAAEALQLAEKLGMPYFERRARRMLASLG